MPQPDEIVSFIRSKGPVLPVDIAKFLNTNTIFAGAHLSELTSRGLVKVSSVKVGGSPLYYLPGQEPRLQEYSDRLHEKERRVYDLLKKELLLKDSEQTPLARVALRQMKDFAKPVEVKIGDTPQLFWRWFMLQMEDVETKIREKYIQKKPEAAKTIQPEPEKTLKAEPIPIPAPEKTDAFFQKSKSEEIAPKPKSRPQEIPRPEPKPRPKTEEFAKPETKPKEEITRPEPKPKPWHEQTVLKQDEEKQLSAAQYLGHIVRYFEQNKIEVLQEEVVKKGQHAWYLLRVPSAIGAITYYAEAKSKKRINEADLSEALVRGSNKKLPVLFMTNGKLTKSTENMLQNEFKAITLTFLQ